MWNTSTSSLLRKLVALIRYLHYIEYRQRNGSRRQTRKRVVTRRRSRVANNQTRSRREQRGTRIDRTITLHRHGDQDYQEIDTRAILVYSRWIKRTAIAINRDWIQSSPRSSSFVRPVTSGAREWIRVIPAPEIARIDPRDLNRHGTKEGEPGS